jgi:hypothetical protein
MLCQLTEGGTVVILRWNPGPESPTALFTTVANQGDNLPGAATERQPNPTLVRFGVDEASHLI